MSSSSGWNGPDGGWAISADLRPPHRQLWGVYEGFPHEVVERVVVGLVEGMADGGASSEASAGDAIAEAGFDRAKDLLLGEVDLIVDVLVEVPGFLAGLPMVPMGEEYWRFSPMQVVKGRYPLGHYRWLVRRPCREGDDPDVAVSRRGNAVIVSLTDDH